MSMEPLSDMARILLRALLNRAFGDGYLDPDEIEPFVAELMLLCENSAPAPAAPGDKLLADVSEQYVWEPVEDGHHRVPGGTLVIWQGMVGMGTGIGKRNIYAGQLPDGWAVCRRAASGPAAPQGVPVEVREAALQMVTLARMERKCLEDAATLLAWLDAQPQAGQEGDA